MKEFTAPSGAKVVIGVAAWGNFQALQGAVFREAAKIGFDLKGFKMDTEINLGGLISTFANVFLSIAGSPEVYALLWPCLEKSTYNGHKITQATFEPIETRQDYFEILKEFALFNVTPFLPKTYLEYWAKLKTTLSDTQKS
jgi:hypothetical protein